MGKEEYAIGKKCGMLIDEWLSMQDRRKRFERMNKVKDLRRDIKEKMEGIEIVMEYNMKKDCVIIGAKRYKWRGNR